ncbi:hypothetical protein AB0D04_13080 [Streptomyces sp. NPDC048483]|uniref:hypothetical protein n=1 Tax=Streptomyces sp. NPDC048483 TaxID=3154927 RepID=UPI00342E824A
MHTLEVAERPGPEDAAALAAVVERPANATVGARALHTAASVLEDAEAADPRLVEALGAVARDGHRSMVDRTLSLSALHWAPGDAATAELVRATGCDALDMQVSAALALTEEHRLDDHRDLLVRLVARWPVEDAPVGADAVRERLEESEPTG